MSASVAKRFDAETLIAAVAAEGWPVDLTDAVLHTEGWENVVVETADGWILRFPRAEDVPFDREVAILRRLRGRLPVPIPNVEFTGTRTRFAAYRKLVGASLDGEISENTAASLARFLATMHESLSPEETVQLGIPAVDHGRTLEIVLGGLDQIPAEHRHTVESLAEKFEGIWVAGRVAGPMVPLHNDFHTGNMVFDDRGELVGIWDFSCVLLGEPCYDLRYLDMGPRGLLDRVADHYGRLTGRQIDVAAAVVANRLEDVQDAVETGRMELFDRARARWARTP